MRFHPAGKKILVNTLLFMIIINPVIWLLFRNPALTTLLAIASLILLFLIAQFFRYPNRIVTIAGNQILSPADGTICMIEESEEPEYLKHKTLKISIFMSPLNVHINWVPVVGKVSYLRHKDGEFYAAFKDKSAEENERFCTAIQLPDGREIMTKQVAGAVARRILNFLHLEQQVDQTTELGFIRFGSRVDLYLPVDTKLHVKLGDKVTGSQTVIGEFSFN